VTDAVKYPLQIIRHFFNPVARNASARRYKPTATDVTNKNIEIVGRSAMVGA